MDLVILLMWGRIWVALLVQSPQIHLHTFTHTHISVCTQEVQAAEGGERRGLYHEMQGWTLSKRWDYIFSRCISPQFQPVPGSKGLVGSPSTPQVDFQAASSRGWRRGPSVLPRAHLLKLA